MTHSQTTLKFKTGVNLNILHRYVVKLLIPSFLVSLLLFTFFVEILDISVNLVRYLLQNVSLLTILKIQYLYLPTSFGYALPVSILFSVSFTMSNLYAHNELIAVYAAGVSLFRFVVPLIFLGMVLSVGNFFFKENIEIDFLKRKNELVRITLNQDLGKSNTNVSVLDQAGKVVYHAGFYDEIDQSISDVSVVVNDEKNNLILRVDADNARWNGTQWIFDRAKIYRYDNINKKVELTLESSYTAENINVHPENFERITNNIDEMQYEQAFEYIETLKKNGLPFRKLLAETYARIPLAISPFIVMLIACFSANAYGKNTFLISLLVSLITAIVYYSSDLIGSVLATRFIISPLLGAWLSVIVTISLSVVLYKITSR